MNVTGWRTTLESAFHNAFPEANGGRKLEILQADNVRDTTANAAKAVEAMYEMLANAMTVQKEPVVEAPRPTPAARASTKAKSTKTP